MVEANDVYPKVFEFIGYVFVNGWQYIIAGVLAIAITSLMLKQFQAD